MGAHFVRKYNLSESVLILQLPQQSVNTDLVQYKCQYIYDTQNRRLNKINNIMPSALSQQLESVINWEGNL